MTSLPVVLLYNSFSIDLYCSFFFFVTLLLCEQDGLIPVLTDHAILDNIEIC